MFSASSRTLIADRLYCRPDFWFGLQRVGTKACGGGVRSAMLTGAGVTLLLGERRVRRPLEIRFAKRVDQPSGRFRSAAR